MVGIRFILDNCGMHLVRYLTLTVAGIDRPYIFPGKKFLVAN